ncbi:MAG: DUF104 domain-containing protein [Anaerolineae bacterium]|nr:DUF104 domain-containing protein [Anaerolineae bacterium]
MVLKARYEGGKLVLLSPPPAELQEGAEVLVTIETTPRPRLPRHAVILDLPPEDDDENEATEVIAIALEGRPRALIPPRVGGRVED